MKTTFEIFTDGACQGNPGAAGVGFVIFEDGTLVKEFSQAIGDATNNIAEYTALIYALQEALILKADVVKVNTDSELMCRQVQGSYKIKNENLKFLNGLVQHLIRGFETFEIQSIPREKNTKADKLATASINKKHVKVVAPVFNIGEESPSSIG